MQDFKVMLEAASDYNEFVGSGAEEDRNALRHFEVPANKALPDDVISKALPAYGFVQHSGCS
ncbi:hypothetical protein [Klebsiella pneumoniae]|uniref:hypothetical protein n=1 Tax=Klebsiella pneumoniae TaxID=573 RepID=UPI0037533442